MYQSIKNFKLVNSVEKAKNVYLWASFWLTFVMFSATKFQLDHYTNIIMPFAAILCARYLTSKVNHQKLAMAQLVLSSLLAILTIGLSAYLFKFSLNSAIIILPLAVLIYLKQKHHFTYIGQILVFPALAIMSTLVFALLVNQTVYRPYDVGYNLAKIANQRPLSAGIYDFNIGWTPLEFHSQLAYHNIESAIQLPESGNYYITLKKADWLSNHYQLDQSKFTIQTTFCGNTIDKIIPNYANSERLAKHLDCYMLLEHQ